MTLEADVAALTTATTNLLNAVNVSKATLDQKVADAATQADLAAAYALGATAAQDGAEAALQTITNVGEIAASLDAIGIAADNMDAIVAAPAQAAAAATSATQAQAYASQAQATNPDSPIRLNPRKVSADFTVPATYNAASVGPMAVAEGITITVADHATWSIN